MENKEKKVIAFIVEGSSDEAVIGSVMKEYFSNEQIQFVVVHGFDVFFLNLTYTVCVCDGGNNNLVFFMCL